LDFNAQNVITIGLDVTDEFNITVQIMTSLRYVKLTLEFLKHMFSLMGYIFSNILDTKYKKIIFLDTEKYKLSTMRYRDENVLVIESNIVIPLEKYYLIQYLSLTILFAKVDLSYDHIFHVVDIIKSMYAT
jgi:hypothetical protein